MNLTKEKNQASMGHDLLNYLMTIFANGPPLKVVHHLSECNSLDQFPDSCISQLSILNVCLWMNSWDKNTSISLQHYANYSVVKHHNINPYLMNSCRSNHLKSRYSSSLIFTYKTQIVFGPTAFFILGNGPWRYSNHLSQERTSIGTSDLN